MIATVSLNTCIDRVVTANDFAVGQHCSVQLTSETPAGKAVNVARILGALGCPVTLFGLVGEDAAAALAECLSALPITNCVHSIPIRTRINTTIIDAHAGTETHLRERGATVATETVHAVGAAIEATLSPGDWVVFSGSLPPGITPEFFGEVIGALVAKDFRVVADITSDGLVAAVQAGVSLIKPNRAELTALAGEVALGTAALVSAARRVVAEYSKLTLLVSDGDAGAVLVSARGAWHAEIAAAATVVNTVGAGDALLAGYLAASVDNTSAADALHRAVGVATASLACARSGTIDPAPLSIPINVVALP